MKNIIILIVVYLLSQSNVRAQDCSCLLSNKVMKFVNEKKIKELFQLYDSVAQIQKPTILSYSIALDYAIQLKDTFRVRKYLELSILNQDFNSKENIAYNFPDIENVINTESIYIKFDSLFTAWTPYYNLKIYNTIDKIIIRDRYVRELTEIPSFNSLFLLNIMNYTDSINELELKDICIKLGRFPGVSEIGKYKLGLLRVIMVHFIAETDSSVYFPLVQKSILENNLYPSFLTDIIDRSKYRFENPTQFGLLKRGGNTDELHFYPIDDISNVDKRRSYFCLPSLRELKIRNPKIILPEGYE